MSWETQARDSKGRFTSKKVTPPVKKSRRTRRKSKDVLLFTNFLLDDTASIRFNGMTDSLRDGYTNAINAIEKSCKKDKLDVVYGSGKFGTSSYHEYIFTPNPNQLIDSIKSYEPSQGRTALYKAIINIINDIDNKIKDSFSDREVKVQLTILTDGQDNDSRYELPTASRLVREKMDLGWNISFLGSKDIAKNLNVDDSNVLEYETSEEGSKEAMGIYTTSVATYVGTVSRGVDSNVGFFAD